MDSNKRIEENLDYYNRCGLLLEELDISYPPCGFSCPPGWFDIVEACLRDMIAAGWDRDLQQVKEKFGGLRIYIGGCTDDILECIGRAELESFRICQECGSPGKCRDLSWLATLCDNCLQHRQ